ncbi:transcriptional regulator BadM/Rrf2 [Acetobacter tropicalis NBRC 101654]|uniref:Transcriptional regulator BadM/Rrf2 n=1 Tax=Acetobacter tropicalis NBRC 101654 TaxID=749388 RepID=F7VDT4_9PROT|nr:transcriptional regulator BadM/Rrf2 [Acetobacter tropicalis NBRC 101654]
MGRPRRDISLVDIINAVTQDDQGGDDGPQGPLFTKVIEPSWKLFDKELTIQMKKTSLDDLVKKAESSGLKRPLSEPITFSI